MPWTIASPRPVPLSFVVKNGWKTRSLWSGAIPEPLSATAIPAKSLDDSPLAPGPRARETRRTPPSGMAWTELRNRFRKTWRRSSGSA